MKRAPLRTRAARACTCAAIGDEHAFLCPKRPRRGRVTRKRKALRTRRATERRSGRVRDKAFLAFVHTLPCAARTVPGHRCQGPIEADHMGERPAGRKANDDTCAALCSLGHRERTDFSGPFKTWTRAQMRAWLDEQIAETQAAYQTHLAARAAGDAIPF